MGLLNRLLPGRRDAGLPPELGKGEQACSRTFTAMPPDMSGAEEKLWALQLDKARAMWGELRADTEGAPACTLEKRIARGPTLAVNSRTLLEPVGGPGRYVTPRLHANKMGAGVIVMAMPRADEEAAWHQQREAEAVSHVVRLGTAQEVRDLGAAAFDPTASGPQRGALKPAAGSTPVRHWDVSVAPGTVISPVAMRDLFDKMAAHPPRPGQGVAFQSPQGDDRSAVFSVGWKLYQAVDRANREHRPFTEEDVADVVQEGCMGVHINRSASLIGLPEHVTSLLALGTLLLSSPPKAATVRFQAGHEERVYMPGAYKAPLLPPGASKADQRAMDLHRADGELLAGTMPQLPVEAESLYRPLQGGNGRQRIHWKAAFTPDARLQVLNAARLHGAWAGQKTLILERPGPAKDLAWALACLQHNIAAVVDLSTEEERGTEPPAMSHGVHAYGPGTHARFEWREGPEITFGEELAHATVRAMQVSAKIDGRPVLRDISGDQVFAKDVSPAQRPLELIKVALDPHHAIPPSKLLGIARMMEFHRAIGGNQVVAVQCPDGDVRAAVVAAADAIHSRFQAGNLDAAGLVETVRSEWARLCLDYSIDLRDHPEHLTSLLAMGERMLASAVRR